MYAASPPAIERQPRCWRVQSTPAAGGCHVPVRTDARLAVWCRPATAGRRASQDNRGTHDGKGAAEHYYERVLNAQTPVIGALTFGTLVILVVVAIATATDLRSRRVPIWLTLGTIFGGLALSQSAGMPGIWVSLIGLGAGVLVLLPMVLLGGFGGGDALLLGAIGTWQGWQFVVATTLWTAFAGGILALIAWRHGQRSFAYVPAIAIGTILAIITS